MARAPFQVIVFLFVQQSAHERLYAVFRRSDQDSWQAIAGGGEDLETPAKAAARETLEEARVVAGEALMPSIRELLSPRQSSRGQITGRRIYSSYRNTPLA